MLLLYSPGLPGTYDPFALASGDYSHTPHLTTRKYFFLNKIIFHYIIHSNKRKLTVSPVPSLHFIIEHEQESQFASFSSHHHRQVVYTLPAYLSSSVSHAPK